MMPGAAWLTKVGASKTPEGPAVVAGLAAVALLLANLNAPKVVEVIAAVSIVWINLAYLFVTVPLLASRCRGWPGIQGHRGGRYRLGNLGFLVNTLAVVWGAGGGDQHGLAARGSLRDRMVSSGSRRWRGRSG